MKPKLEFSEKARNLKPGIYEHYKGNRYKVLGVSHHSETLEELVVYQALYGDGDLWVRPIDVFFDEKEIDGKKVPRFKFIEN